MNLNDHRKRKTLGQSQKRRDEKPVYDLNQDLVANEPLNRGVTERERDTIRKYLGMNRRMSMPKCRYRVFKKAVKLDLALGFTRDQMKANLGLHTRKLHVCSECRCQYTAGLGTRGWWYWPKDNIDGLLEVGHYGVGPCWNHGPHNRESFNGIGLKNYREMILKEMEIARNVGVSPQAGGQFVIEVTEDADSALVRNEMREALSKTGGIMDGLLSELSLLSHAGVEPLNEQGKANPKFDLKDTLAIANTSIKIQKQMADIAKMEFDTSKGDYCHRDTLTVMIKRFMVAVENKYRPLGSQDDWDEFSVMMKAVIAGMQAASGRSLYKQEKL